MVCVRRTTTDCLWLGRLWLWLLYQHLGRRLCGGRWGDAGGCRIATRWRRGRWHRLWRLLPHHHRWRRFAIAAIRVAHEIRFDIRLTIVDALEFAQCVSYRAAGQNVRLSCHMRHRRRRRRCRGRLLLSRFVLVHKRADQLFQIIIRHCGRLAEYLICRRLRSISGADGRQWSTECIAIHRMAVEDFGWCEAASLPRLINGLRVIRYLLGYLFDIFFAVAARTDATAAHFDQTTTAAAAGCGFQCWRRCPTRCWRWTSDRGSCLFGSRCHDARSSAYPHACIRWTSRRERDRARARMLLFHFALFKNFSLRIRITRTRKIVKIRCRCLIG